MFRTLTQNLFAHFQNETLIAIKAPHGTTLEVPDPDEAVDYPQRRYRIVLRSTMGPIDVYLVSQFEEINGVNAAPNIPSSPEFNTQQSTVVSEDRGKGIAECRGKEIEVQGQDGHGPSSDFTTAQDFVSGIMKIVPSDVDSDADYWLLSDADVSITDMWRAESGVEWNELDKTLQQDILVTRDLTATPTNPPKVSEAPSTSNPTGVEASKGF
ncbi:putative transcription factor E2F-DP family [Lupinus albus]|uniref:Putative transcription factor E2F-DP family n=1 Tax=Lupinus albus TaxID=3870 RepID=A0A6A4NVD1_LUPAL|nr:putative transcription factor E2F-DP family [Lupinus albus]